MATATETAHKRVDIRRNDTVKVLSGRDKGKQDAYCACSGYWPGLVEHVMIVKKHVRPNRSAGSKRIAEQESSVSISKVQLVCSTCGPVRIGHAVQGDRKSEYAKSVEQRWISSESVVR